MRILRISIRNFRGVTACDVSLSPVGMTIIEGPNEVGKSSLAEAVDLLLEFPHDSRHRRVEAVQPVHRSEGTEVEMEFTTGPYHLVYSKRWFHRPETRLAILAPVPDNLGARQAHDKVAAILAETLDDALYKALRFVQGEKIQQGSVGSSSTLIGALDRVASGGAADPKAESTLWQAIQDERIRYFTPTGRTSQEREHFAAEFAAAETDVRSARSLLDELEEAGEEYRVVLTRLDEIKTAEEDARTALVAATTLRDELSALELEIQTLKVEVGAAALSEAAGRQALEARTAKVASVSGLGVEVERLTQACQADEPVLSTLELAAQEAESKLSVAEQTRQLRATELDLAEGDFTFRRAEIDHRLLSNRLDRVRAARKLETEAQEFLQTCKVSKDVRAQVEKAVRTVTEARVARDVGSPTITVEALAELDVSVNGMALHLAAGAKHEYSAPSETVIGLEGAMRVKVRSGHSGGDLQPALTKAEEALTRLLTRYALEPDDPMSQVNELVERRRDAERQIESARKSKADALEDLSEEELSAKVQTTGAVVVSYPKKRPSDPPMPLSREDSERDYGSARQRLTQSERVERDQRASVTATHTTQSSQLLAANTNRELLRGEQDRFKRAHADLAASRAHEADSHLEEALAQAVKKSQFAQQVVADVEARYAARDPETVHLQFENAEQLVKRLDEEQRLEVRKQVELETVLRVKGSRDIQAAVDTADANSARLTVLREELERRASAAELLYETFSRHRDSARRAYVAPYREQIEKLARLVFGPDTGVQIDPDDLSLTSRTVGGITVPFDSLSTGSREQLAVLAQLACAILVNPDGASGDAGVPVILDDALGNSDPSRLRRLAPAFASAAKQAQVIVMTSTPDRYGRVGDATVIRLAGF